MTILYVYISFLSENIDLCQLHFISIYPVSMLLSLHRTCHSQWTTSGVCWAWWCCSLAVASPSHSLLSDIRSWRSKNGTVPWSVLQGNLCQVPFTHNFEITQFPLTDVVGFYFIIITCIHTCVRLWFFYLKWPFLQQLPPSFLPFNYCVSYHLTFMLS